nr:venom protease-like [Onthophagus taurus]
MMRLVCLLVVTSFISNVSGQDRYCTTPLRDDGRCIIINSCEPLITLLKTQNQNQEIRNYLVRSVCGYSGNLPMVCCPQYGRSLPDTSSTSSTTPSTTTAKINDNLEDRSSNSLPTFPGCGLTNSTDFRVVGGTPAKLGQFPWMVALGYRNSKNENQPRWLCGGSLITKKHVLTAAHCVKGRDDLYLARLGELELYSDTEGANPIDVPIIDKVIHADYNTMHYTNDIAILTLANKVEHPSVWPICLPTSPSLRSQKFVKYYGFVAGWGSIYFNGPSSSTLQYASVPIVSTETCKAAFSKIKQAIIDDNVLCAGYPDGSKDSCKGDSGGPFMLPRQENGQFVYYLFGVVSYGVKCAEPGYYGVYSSTGAFFDWITANLR